MNDERLLHDLGSWLKDTDAPHPDAERITARAMAQVPRVDQRGRWWPLPALDRASQPAPPASGSALFSALRFVTAGIIIGLFGGFLLAGVLITPQGDTGIPAAVTDSPSPMTIDRLLSVAETEEVEPGVLRIIDDGIRRLAAADNTGIATAQDGGIWLLSKDGFLRVGGDGAYEWPSGQAAVSDFEVAPDATVWAVAASEDGLSTLWSLDDTEWTRHGSTSETRAIEVAPDGAMWAFWQDEGSETVSVGYLAGGDRRAVGTWDVGTMHGGDLYLAGTDAIWVAGAPAYREGKPELYRLVDGSLQQAYAAAMVAADVGADGTAWFISLDELMRLDGAVEGAEPERWALPDAMTDRWDGTSRWTLMPGDAFRATPDGSVWFALRAESGPPVPEVHCGGIAGFDGTSWMGPFLAEHCVESIALAADGSVWLLARDAQSSDDLVDLFVIDPEAASAA